MKINQNKMNLITLIYQPKVLFSLLTCSRNYIHIAKYLSSIIDEQYKTLADNTILAHEMFPSGWCTCLKNAIA